MRKEKAVRRWKIAAAGAAAALLAAGCGTSSSGNAGGGNAPVTLTIWHNYGTEQNATALVNLAKAFHQLHPSITVNVVSQPASNYFALLQSKAISRNGPDLAVMWTGLFTLQYKGFLQNLKGLVPASSLAQVDPNALKWTSDSFNPANGPYVIPLENQFYIGFYNKADFTKAGVASVPTDWSQLYAACTKLKKAGFTPMVYGNGGQPLGATFYPWYDMSYMMIGSYSVSQWQGLYSGSTPWTSSVIGAQLANGNKLHGAGCTNSDVVTNTDNLGQFESGKAAMMVDGTWDTQKFTKALGSKVAAFAINGTSTSNPVNQEMLNFVSKDAMTAYPMLDNVVQGNVVNIGSKFLPAVLNGSESISKALQDMQTTLQQLPANQRGNTFP